MRLKEKQLYLTCEALGTRPNQVELFNLAQRVSTNPRTVTCQLISSQSRYDHFDTAAYKIVKTQTWKTVSIWLAFGGISG